MTLFPSQDSFTRGEISPRLHSRASLDLYRGALAHCENFLTLPHGGIRKRGGTYFVNGAKYDDRNTRLIDFKFSADQAYCLELGDLYCRVHAYGAYLGIEFATPWTAAQIDMIQYVQSADVMWLVHPDHGPRKITRVNSTTFTLTEVSFNDGPFAAVNLNDGITAQASAITGSITITASSGIFSAADVGRLFRIEMESYTGIPPWSPGAVIVNTNEEVNGVRTRYDGNVYQSTSSGSSSGPGGWRYGGTPPTHLKGVEPDGPIKSDNESINGVAWLYLHSGFGVARITGYTSPTSVTATVISRFPEETVSGGQARWSFGAFTNNSWPVAVALFEERLVFASKLSVYASKTGNFDSFRIGEADDDALEFLLAANEANDIVWLADADGFLAIGTIGGVRALSGSGLDEALTPSSFKNRSSSTMRCSRLRPLNTGQAFLYVANGRRAIAEMLQGSSGRFESADASLVSEHLFKQGGGITSVAYQEAPDSIAWFTTVSGDLIGFTYQRDQEVRGFHRQTFNGGKAKSVCVTPGQNGADDVWVLVERVINGVPKQFVEILSPAFEYAEAKDAYCVDCGLSYSGSPVSTLGGLGHLEGEAVSVLADAVPYEGLVVSGGQITLPAAASVVHAGLPYQADASTLSLDVGARDGSLMGRRKRVTQVILSLLETDVSGLQVQSLQRKRWEQVKVPTVVLPDGAVSLQTRTVEVPVDDSWEGGAQIRIRHTGPGPCTIRAVTPAFDHTP